MKILFLEEAQYELDDAIEYYNNELVGLGDEFFTEVLSALDRIAKFPKAWHPYSARTRRCQTKRFPYAIVYQIRREDILIIAIAHLHRKPEYWGGKIRNSATSFKANSHERQRLNDLSSNWSSQCTWWCFYINRYSKPHSSR